MSFGFADIDSIFQQALERPREERAAFVDSACKGDSALREEVESLLRYHDEPGGALDRPLNAIRQAALALPPAVEAGQQLGSYTVLGLLGSGGMGRVYLAHDARLDRKVALKFLHAEAVSTGRLEREVKAVSALNHPNILTIYEIGWWEGQPFLASEHVEGETLRQRLERGPIASAEILRIACQTALALEAAHKAGFMHRDIKPENIMLREDGLVKVLDFGLAKRVDGSIPAVPKAMFSTETGLVVGTVAYMSPEQLTGVAVDGRTDLWSLGVVLWEMAAGKSPFHRPLVAQMIASILALEPVAPDVQPKALNSVIKRCLSRDLAGRYQAAGDLINDLNSLGPSDGWRARPAVWRPAPRRLIAAGLGGLMVMIVLGLGWWSWSSRHREQALFPTQPVARLTVQGRPSDVAISPDGRYIAYVSLESSQASIWVRQSGPESDVRLVPRRSVRYAGLSFGPDNSSLYYTVYEDTSGIANLYRIAVIGGQSRLVLKNVDTAPAFSPDGDRFAFVRGATDGSTQVVIAGEGVPERVLATRRPPLSYPLQGTAWSPSGDRIAVIAGERGKGNRLVALSVADGKEIFVADQAWEYAGQPAWVNGGRALLLVAFGNPRPITRIVQIGYPGGEARDLFPGDPNSYRGLSVTSSLHPAGLVTLRAEEMMAIWDVSDPKKPRSVTLNAGRYHGVAWLKDGLVTQSDLSGRPDLWRLSRDGSARVRLTDDEAVETDPIVCGQGETVVFRSNKSGRWNLWSVDADGSNLRPLTSGAGPDSSPSCAPDGRWVYYTSYQSGSGAIWRSALSGGEETRLTYFVSRQADVSPDGRRLVSFVFDEAAAAQGSVAVLDADSGSILSRMKGMPGNAVFRWHPGGKEIVLVQTENGVSNLVSRTLDGGRSRKITQFDTEQISGWAWSGDGKSLACVRGLIQHDLMRVGGPDGSSATGHRR